MAVSLTTLITEVQARCNALTSSSTISEVIDAAIAAKKVERAGGSITRTTLDTELQRVINLSGGGSQIEDLIALAAANENNASGSGYVPDYGAIAPFAGRPNNFTDANGLEWLKTGIVSTDLAGYPNGPRAYLPPTSSVALALPVVTAAAHYHENSGLWIVAGSDLRTSPDLSAWTVRSASSVTDIVELPSGMVIAVAGSSTYYYATDPTSWTAKSGNPIGMLRAVATLGGYWYGCNGSQTGWARDNGTITSVAVASGSAWEDIAYSPKLNRLVMVGTNLCQTNDNAYGGSWTIRTIPSGIYKAVQWFPDIERFIAVGNSGVCSSSADGITWIAHVAITGANLGYLFYDKHLRALWTTGDSGALMYTRDGSSWVSVGAGTNAAGPMASKAGSGVLVGNAGRFAAYIELVGVEVASQISAGVPNYTRVK